MSEIRGWPLTRPITNCVGCAGIHFLRMAFIRNLLFVGLIFVAVGAHAALYITNDPADVRPTESVYLSGVSSFWQGVTSSGVRYRFSSDDTNSYSNHYITGSVAVRNTLRVEFDRPVAAVGAQVMVSGFVSSDSSSPYQSNTPFAYVADGGYYGLVSNNPGFREATFVSSSGPITLSRLDIRPLPVAAEDSLAIYENSQRTFDARYILSNDFQADGAILASGPLHAEFFQLNADGSFIYRPAKNYQGLDSFLYEATNGNGAAVSTPVTVTLHVLPVNCPPSFTHGPDVTCLEDDGLQTIANWAKDMISGPANEIPQSLDWEITTNNDSLFAVKPQISARGDLTYQPALYENGAAKVTIKLHDDGGTAEGGLDTSDSYTFTITVTPKEHAPVLEQIPDTAIRQGDALVLRVKGSEFDAGSSILYSLDKAPQGAWIDQVSGQVVWRPTEPRETLYPFVIRATETGSKELSTTTSFNVEVLASAEAPIVPVLSDISAIPDNEIRFRITAETSGARFFLASSAPDAFLDPDTGEFHWKPSQTEAGKDYRFEVSIVDYDKSNLCTVRSFAVHVLPPIVRKANNPSNKGRGLQTGGQAAMQFASGRKARTAH